MSNTSLVILLVILVILSGLFSMTEIAFSSADKFKLKTNYDSNPAKYKLAYDLVNDFNNLISTVLVANNLVNIASTSISTILFIRLFGEVYGPVYSTIFITIIVLIFGDIFPKLIGESLANKLIYILCYPLVFFKYVFFIITYPVDKAVKKLRKLWHKEDDTPLITDEELIDIVQQIEDQGDIDEDKSDLIQNAIEFKEISAYDAMTPRVDIIGLEVNTPIKEIKNNIDNIRHSYLPVYEDSLDNIIGLVSSKEIMKNILLKKRFTLKDILREVIYVNETKSIEDILKDLIKEKVKMAVVVDEFGGTDGILTKENILEELVGDIWDEKDKVENEYQELGNNEYIVSGDMDIYDMLDLIDLDIPDFESEYSTVGGWASEMLDKVPDLKDSFKFHNYIFTVNKVDDNRVEEIHIKKALTKRAK